jgi:hypothetical protein
MGFVEKIKLLLNAKNIAFLLKNPRSINILGLVRDFPRWSASLEPGRNPLAEKMPWIALSAVTFLERTINKDMLVYEYGSGGSTLFFASRVKEIVSIEHDQAWHSEVMKQINNYNLTNCRVRLIEPRPGNPLENQNIANPDDYASDDERYRGMSFKEYASSIDLYPDNYFDVVLIDGRARPSCYKHARSKVKIGGYLVLDNAERLYYGYIHDSLKNDSWIKREFYGMVPYNYYFSETCVWRRLK